ncbi:MAG: GNAT family N-acetyltransferase [Bacteroidota bacterium]
MTIRPAISDADWAAVQKVRRRVFVDEQGVADTDEWDAWDAGDLRGQSVHHLLAEVDPQPVGAARWRVVEIDGHRWAKHERFAVVPEARGQGIARQLVAATLAAARAAGLGRHVLHAQTYVAGLYEAFGFQVEGGPFDEDGLEHVKMTLTDR